MPDACDFGVAFRTTTSQYRDPIHELRGRERMAVRAAAPSP